MACFHRGLWPSDRAWWNPAQPSSAVAAESRLHRERAPSSSTSGLCVAIMKIDGQASTATGLSGNSMAGSAKRFLSPADRNRRTGGVAAQNRDALIALNLRLVPRLASRFQGYGTSYEDLVQVGRPASRRFIPPSVRRRRRFRGRLERSGASRPGRLPAESRTQRRLRSGRRVSRRRGFIPKRPHVVIERL